MTDHPITLPPELVQQWLNAPRYTKPPKDGTFVVQKCHSLSESEVSTLVENAARWGSDQELEACCKWLDKQTLCGHHELIPALRDARRPNPPSLKEQALALISHDPANQPFLSEEGIATIRRALESLPD